MKDSIKKQLGEGLEQYTTDIKENEFEVDQDLKYEEVRVDVVNVMTKLVNKHTETFGDRNSSFGAVLSVIEKLYL